MTHQEASQLCQHLRNANAEETNGTWKWNGKGFDWVPNAEHNFQVVKLVGGTYSVELPLSSFKGSLK